MKAERLLPGWAGAELKPELGRSWGVGGACGKSWLLARLRGGHKLLVGRACSEGSVLCSQVLMWGTGACVRACVPRLR